MLKSIHLANALTYDSFLSYKKEIAQAILLTVDGNESEAERTLAACLVVLVIVLGKVQPDTFCVIKTQITDATWNHS